VATKKGAVKLLHCTATRGDDEVVAMPKSGRHRLPYAKREEEEARGEE